MDPAVDELWFTNIIAFMVCSPGGLAIVMGANDTYVSYFKHWRELRRSNPAFPPSLADFFLRGQETSLPGASKLNKNMPEKIHVLLDAAVDDVDAEVIANSINGDLHHLIDEARHFAAILYAPGDVKLPDKRARKKKGKLTEFPPPAMRNAFEVRGRRADTRVLTATFAKAPHHPNRVYFILPPACPPACLHRDRVSWST